MKRQNCILPRLHQLWFWWRSVCRWSADENIVQEMSRKGVEGYHIRYCLCHCLFCINLFIVMTLSSFCAASNATFAGISSWIPCQFSQWQQRRCEDLGEILSGMWLCPKVRYYPGPFPSRKFGDPYFQTISITKLLVSSWNPIVGLHFCTPWPFDVSEPCRRNPSVAPTAIKNMPIFFSVAVTENKPKKTWHASSTRIGLLDGPPRQAFPEVFAGACAALRKEIYETGHARGDEKSHWLDDLSNFQVLLFMSLTVHIHVQYISLCSSNHFAELN